VADAAATSGISEAAYRKWAGSVANDNVHAPRDWRRSFSAGEVSARIAVAEAAEGASAARAFAAVAAAFLSGAPAPRRRATGGLTPAAARLRELAEENKRLRNVLLEYDMPRR